MADEKKEYPEVDPDHRVPDDQWGDVRRRAQAIRAESEESETE